MTFAKSVSLSAVALLIAGAASAQQAEVAPAKVAFVMIEKAVAKTQEGSVRLKELEDWAKPRQEELTRLNKEIGQLQSDLATKRGIANDQAVDEINRKLVARQREFEDKQRIARRDFDERQTAVLKDLGGRLQEVISRYGDENRFTAILMLKSDYVAYIANSADITDTIIKLYDQRFPLGTAPAPAAKPTGSK
jgi:outer membrane protein